MLLTEQFEWWLAVDDPEPKLPPNDPDPDPLNPIPRPNPDEPGPDVFPRIDPSIPLPQEAGSTSWTTR